MASVAVDVMSGDCGAPECVPGALRALVADPALELILVGKPEVIEPALAQAGADVRARLSIHPAASVVGMSEHPREAIRRRKDSSMRLAIDLVKEGRAAGHGQRRQYRRAHRDGALRAEDRGSGRTRSHHVDGAGAQRRRTRTCSTSARIPRPRRLQLAQFATMGSIVARDVFGIANPRIGLLNIGEEETKGHELVQDAHELIRASGVNYLGFVEGNNIFDGSIDVVVTDGFTGNVALKTMEGLAKLIVEQLRAEFTRDSMSKLSGLLARPVLRRVGEGLDPRRYNGACMVGLTGVVVKSHGSADRVAFAQAITTAATAMRRGLPAAIANALANAVTADNAAVVNK